MTQTDPREFGRRLRAARAYIDGDPSQEDFAEALHTSTSSIKRWESGEAIDVNKRAGVVARASKVCGLPEEFFTADFALLTSTTGETPTPVDVALADLTDRFGAQMPDLVRSALAASLAEGWLADVIRETLREDGRDDEQSGSTG